MIRAFPSNYRRVAICMATIASALVWCAGASAFDISSFTVSPTTTQALDHPTVTMDVQFTGTNSEDLRNLTIDIPSGLLANPESVAVRCTAAQLAATDCPADSKIGTASSVVKVPWWLLGGQWTVPGTLYMVEGAPGSFPSLGAVFSPPLLLPKVGFAVAVQLRTGGDFGITATATEVPRDLSGIEITLKRMTLTMNARAGANADGPYFVTNPSSCQDKWFNAHAETYTGATADRSLEYTVTGCGSVPFSPSFDVDFTSTAPNTLTDLTASVTLPPGHGYVSTANVVSPHSLRPNFGAMGNLCDVADFEATPPNCDPADEVGTFSAATPLLPGALAGTVYLVDAGFSFPSIGAYLSEPTYGVAYRTYGLLSTLPDGRFVIEMPALADGTSTTLPELPLTSLEFTVGAKPGYHDSPIRVKPASTCTADDEAQVTLSSHTGAVHAESIPVSFGPGCQN